MAEKVGDCHMSDRTLKELINAQFPPVENIIGSGILRTKGIMVLYGEPGVGKSWLAAEAGLSISTGKKWLVYPTKMCKVILIDCENPEEESQIRWRELESARGLSLNGNMRHVAEEDIKIDTSNGIGRIEELIQKHQAKVVILDNMYKMTRGDLTRNRDANILIDGINSLRDKYGVTFIIVHHPHQPTLAGYSGRRVTLGQFEMFGSSFLNNWPDTILEVKLEEEGSDNVIVTMQKHRRTRYPAATRTYTFDRHTKEFKLDLRM